jgi:hypothetical protein
MKKIVIIGLLILVVGIVVAGVSFAVMGFSFGGFNVEKYEAVTTEIGTDYTKIDIQAKIEDIRILRVDAKAPTLRVVCSENSRLKHTVTVENDTLTIRTVENRKWYDHIGIFAAGKPEITLYIPDRPYDLQVQTETGDVEVCGRSPYGEVSIRTGTGDVRGWAEVSGSVTVQTSTGDILWMREDTEDPRPLSMAGDLFFTTSTGEIRASSITCQGTAEIRVSTGDAWLGSFGCAALESTGSTGDITLTDTVVRGSLSIRRSTGDVRFERCDAGELHIPTSTGSVTGTLLTEKVFFPKTETGKVSVPKSTTGGECEITTSTGNIQIGFSPAM